MGDASVPAPLSLSNPDAAQWNRDLILAFQEELAKNPAADLMSMFPEPYHHEHRLSQYCQLSYAGKINLQTLNELRDALTAEPEVNLISKIPVNYKRRITMAIGPKVVPHAERRTKKATTELQGPELPINLDLAETAAIVFPLSEPVVALLAQHPGGLPSDTEETLIMSLKQLIWKSPKVWEFPARGVVVKCNQDIVAKVVWGNWNYTEYTTMQFLAAQAPNIPAPRPHGLIAFGPFRVIFMSYIPDMTLTQVWPSLSHEGKLSIQQQLEDIFGQLRSLRQDDGKPLGGTNGEGARELRVDQRGLFKNITTASEFSDLQFSARHHGSKTYIAFLCSLLEHANCDLMHGSVFTHGDVRTDNIMVKQDPNKDGNYIVSGIIDWEDSGFYPEYHECTTLTCNMSPVDENDWYHYLPGSISPSKFPIRWLVDRLWGIHLWTT